MTRGRAGPGSAGGPRAGRGRRDGAGAGAAGRGRVGGARAERGGGTGPGRGRRVGVVAWRHYRRERRSSGRRRAGWQRRLARGDRSEEWLTGLVGTTSGQVGFAQ